MGMSVVVVRVDLRKTWSPTKINENRRIVPAFTSALSTATSRVNGSMNALQGRRKLEMQESALSVLSLLLIQLSIIPARNATHPSQSVHYHYPFSPRQSLHTLNFWSNIQLSSYSQ